MNAYHADGWGALGDPTRRLIFERIAARPQAVVELARDLPISRPAVSQHLKILKDAGLVKDIPVQSRRIYQLNPEGIEALREQLDWFWTRALANYQAAVEESKEGEP